MIISELVALSSHLFLYKWCWVEGGLQSGVVLGDWLTAAVGVEHSSPLLEKWLRIPEWLVDVVCPPCAIFRITRDRSEETPDALVDIQLEEERGTSNI